MTGNDEQVIGPDSPDNYESVVLSFLNAEMAALGLTKEMQELSESSENLDVLVSDFLKQVMVVSDQIQTGRQADSGEADHPILEFAASEETAPSPADIEDAPLETEAEPFRFESRDAMLAEYLTIRKQEPASENGREPADAGQECGYFENMDAAVAEFIPAKEAAASAEYQDAPPDAGVDASQFEQLDAMLAEFITLQEEAAQPGTRTESISIPDPAPAASEASQVQPVPQEPPQAIVSQPEKKSAPIHQFPMPHKTEAASVSIREPETKSAVILKYSAEKAAASHAPVKKVVSKRARPAAEARAINAKTLLIAAACVCLLAVLAVPGQYFPGSSKGASKHAGTQTAPSALLPNHAEPPVLISQVSPKYPELAVQNRTSASVVLELSINSNGNVVKATPVSGPEMFHEEAVRAAMQWRYRPATISGSNVPSTSRATFDFSLKN